MKIRGWKKIGKMSWATTSKPFMNCQVARQTGDLKRDYKDKRYQGQMEIRGILHSQSPVYKSKERAYKWCINKMKMFSSNVKR